MRFLAISRGLFGNYAMFMDDGVLPKESRLIHELTPAPGTQQTFWCCENGDFGSIRTGKEAAGVVGVRAVDVMPKSCAGTVPLRAGGAAVGLRACRARRRGRLVNSRAETGKVIAKGSLRGHTHTAVGTCVVQHYLDSSSSPDPLMVVLGRLASVSLCVHVHVAGHGLPHHYCVTHRAP